MALSISLSAVTASDATFSAAGATAWLTVKDRTASPVGIASAAQGVTGIALASGVTLRVPAAIAKAAAGDAVTVGVRPEHLSVAQDGPLIGKIEVVERLGPETLVNVALGDGGTVIATLPGDSAVKPGDTIRFQPDLARLHVFNESGIRLA